MYITGNNINFERRLHQLPTGTGELFQYSIECNSYLPSGTPQESGRWKKEGNKKDFEFGVNYF